MLVITKPLSVILNASSSLSRKDLNHIEIKNVLNGIGCRYMCGWFKRFNNALCKSCFKQRKGDLPIQFSHIIRPYTVYKYVWLLPVIGKTVLPYVRTGWSAFCTHAALHYITIMATPSQTHILDPLLLFRDPITASFDFFRYWPALYKCIHTCVQTDPALIYIHKCVQAGPALMCIHTCVQAGPALISIQVCSA